MRSHPGKRDVRRADYATTPLRKRRDVVLFIVAVVMSIASMSFIAPLAGATPLPAPTDTITVSVNKPATGPVTGAPVTLTDTLVGEGADSNPAGIVTWNISGVSPAPSCTSSSVTNEGSESATATCTLTFAEASSYTVSANYEGTNYADATATSTVTPAATGYQVSDPTTSGDSFNECPAIGRDTGCELLIVLGSSGATVLSNPDLGTFDGSDDSLVGVVNETGEPVTSVNLSSTKPIFAFDGDEICALGDGHEGSSSGSGLMYGNWTGSNGCSYGPTGAEGPFTSFSGYSSANHDETGAVDFTYPGGLPSGVSTYFSLESALSAATFSVISPQMITFTNAPPADALAGSTYTVSATGGGSGNPVTFSVDASSTSGCSVNSTTGLVTLSAPVGTCVIDANQAGGTDYFAATQVSQSVTDSLIPQTVTFTSGTTGANATETVTLPDATDVATAVSNGPGAVSYSVGGGSTNCSVGPSTGALSFTGAGTCIIEATAAASGDYAASVNDAVLTVTVLAAAVQASPPPPPPPPPTTGLSVVASSASIESGGSWSERASISGLDAGDQADLTGFTFTYAGTGATSYGPTSAPPSAAGTYSVTPSNATVTISPASDQSKYSTTYLYVAGSITITAPKVVVSPPPAVVKTSPSRTPPAPPAPRAVTIVPFAEGSSALSASLKSQISRVALDVKKGPYKVVRLEAYTDNVFTAAFDAQLNRARASAVAAQLAKDLKALKVSGVHIYTAMGVTITLAADNATAAARATNRRVVVILNAS